MACEVCEHCHGPVSREERITICDGYSYHKKCHKCYVCSETNLQNAEVFKGVIFCSSCSQRIFQGCATARRAKASSRSKKHRSKSRVAKRRRKEKKVDGVLELTRLAASTDTDNRSSDTKDPSKSETIIQSTILTVQDDETEKYSQNENYDSNQMKKSSAEIGVTTDVTHEMLKHLTCHVIVEQKYNSQPASPVKPLTKRRKSRTNKSLCSDIRIAELGASTEIANMGLRKKSDLPVTIRSETNINSKESTSLSALNQESDLSGDANEEWDSAYSSEPSSNIRWMDRRIGSILKLPYKCFKKNILQRSSLIDVLITSENNKNAMVKRLRSYFHDEINEHQSRGIKRLYSTINRRKVPYKLGWVNLVSTTSPVQVSSNRTSKCVVKRGTCKHFKRSHSYRCMRKKIMRLAGPTRSELCVIRKRLKNALAPNVLKIIGDYNEKFAAMMISQAVAKPFESDILKNLKRIEPVCHIK